MNAFEKLAVVFHTNFMYFLDTQKTRIKRVFVRWFLLIKTRVKSVEVLRVERVGDEPQSFAKIINLSKCL